MKRYFEQDELWGIVRETNELDSETIILDMPDDKYQWFKNTLNEFFKLWQYLDDLQTEQKHLNEKEYKEVTFDDGTKRMMEVRRENK